MTGEKLRVGVMGAGFISTYHIEGLRAAGAQVVAISSRTLESARKQASVYDIPFVTDQNEAVLAHPEVEAVVIATPDYTHRDLALQAIEAGKPVLLQKPMARNSAECRDIIEAGERAGVPVFVSFMHRYFEEVFAVRELLAQQALGSVFAVRQRNATPGGSWAAWLYSREKVGGGVMMQLGVHGVDLLRHLFGEIEAVKATTALTRKERRLSDGTVVRPDAEDVVFATYRFASGLLATHEVAYNEVAGTDRFRMEIYGESGTAWLRSERGPLALYAPAYAGREGWFQPALPESNPGLRQHRHWIDMLRGEAPHDGSDRDGLAAIQVIEAVYRSAETGQWQEVARA